MPSSRKGVLQNNSGKFTQQQGKTRTLSFLFVGLGLALCAPSGRAQQYTNDYLERVGRPDFHVVQPVEMGFVDLANGNLHLEFPMAAIQQRGGMQLAVKLTYDSRIWGRQPNPGLQWIPDSGHIGHGFVGGWKVLAASPVVSYIASDCPY